MDSRIFLLALLPLLFSSCSIDSKGCETEADCFSGEVCTDNVCIQTSVENNGIVENNGVTTEPKECEKNDDCDFGFCKKPEGICQCAIGEHQCGDQCVSDIDPKFCGGCTECPTDPRGENKCSVTGECEITCTPPFQSCVGDDCPRACVGCSDDSNCGADAPNCIDNECRGCESNNECDRFSQKICDSGSCVQCTELMPSACGGNSCDPKTLSCTETRLRSQEDCEPCVSDAECELNFSCVEMSFAGAKLDGGFCLQKFDGTDCRFPFPVRVSKVSLSTGKTEEYCGISESIMTCKSYTDFGKLCERPSECGLENFSDAQCRPVRGIDRCTHACTSDDDCQGGSFCANKIYCLQN